MGKVIATSLWGLHPDYGADEEEYIPPPPEPTKTEVDAFLERLHKLLEKSL